MPCSLGCSPPAGAPVSCKVKKRCFTYSQSRGIGVFFLDRCQISSEKKKKNKIRESLLWRNWDGGGLSATGSDTARSAERRYGTCCAALLTGRCGGRGGGGGGAASYGGIIVVVLHHRHLQTCKWGPTAGVCLRGEVDAGQKHKFGKKCVSPA